ncbi:histone H3.v1-like [Episyrphus balteatus]|uniref:histone H3.v1-like n=1 Tax=Episyrphus balteatus TaxID=286459 RepID=UPI002484DE72|nr:histone H3.v1-like [Episyrphus balteatus]
MGKKEKRKDEAAATYDEFIKKVREGISSHGKEFLLQIHEKLNAFDELYTEEDDQQQENDDQQEEEDQEQPARELEDQEQPAEEQEEEKEALLSDFEDLDDIAKTRQVIVDNNDAEMIDAGQEPPKAQPESAFIKVIRIKRKRKPAAMSSEQLEAKKPTPSTPPPTPTPSAAVVPTTSSAPATQMDSAAATTRKTSRTTTTMEGTSREKLMPPIVCFKLNVAELNRVTEYNNFVVELDKDCDIPAVFKKTLLLNQKIHWKNSGLPPSPSARTARRLDMLPATVACGTDASNARTSIYQESAQGRRTTRRMTMFTA